MKLGLQIRTFVLATALLAAGCISTKRVVPEDQRLLPAKTASRAELLEGLKTQSQAIKSMTATVALDVSGGSLRTGVLTEYRQTKGFILVDRPNNIRVRAQAPLALATVFDMVSDGRQYRVSVPIRNKFIVGDATAPASNQNPVLNMRPQHLLSALFVDIMPLLANPQIRSTLEETSVGRKSYYIFEFINIAQPNADLVEKLWIDRSTLEVVRKQIFGRDGKVEADVEYTGYQDSGGTSFPQAIVIQRPAEDYTLKITFQKTVLNEQLAADAFVLERPSGSDLVQVDPAATNTTF